MAGWVYDQTHSRDIPSLGGLVAKMPFVAVAFIVACMASIGMPGTVNFIAEVMIVLGSWTRYPVQTIIAVLGIVLTMAYLFRMMRGLFYGSLSELGHHAHDARAWVDRVPLLIMMGTSIIFGIFPGPLLSVIRSGVDPILARIIQVAPIATQVGGAGLP
jgi:NADH-quinone oxidoreductase subunit M